MWRDCCTKDVKHVLQGWLSKLCIFHFMRIEVAINNAVYVQNDMVIRDKKQDRNERRNKNKTINGQGLWVTPQRVQLLAFRFCIKSEYMTNSVAVPANYVNNSIVWHTSFYAKWIALVAFSAFVFFFSISSLKWIYS